MPPASRGDRGGQGELFEGSDAPTSTGDSAGWSRQAGGSTRSGALSYAFAVVVDKGFCVQVIWVAFLRLLACWTEKRSSIKTTCCTHRDGFSSRCLLFLHVPLAQVLHHLDNPEAVSAAGGGSSSSPVAAIEELSLPLLAAVLEVDKEEAAVVRRVEKRLAKDSSIGSSSSATGSLTAAGRQSRASALGFEYRAKALAKDAAAAAEGEPIPTVGSRLSDALQALLADGSATLMLKQQQEAEAGGGDGDTPGVNGAQREAFEILVARFCRAYLGRAVRTAETGSGGAGIGNSAGDRDPSTSSACASTSQWQEVLAACDALERAVGRSGGWDGGWIAVATLLSSAYASRDEPKDAHVRQDREDGEDAELAPAALSALSKVAKEGANGEASSPWLKAEACLHLAGVALWAGDAAEADALLKSSSVARATTRAQQQRTGSSRDGGLPSTTAGAGAGAGATSGDSWAGSLSGPGSDWRERSLRCLVDEKVGNRSAGSAAAAAGDPMASAALALSRVDTAIGAFDESFRLRGAPAGGGAYGDVLGHLGLARGSLLLNLGRLEEARSAVEMVSAGALHVDADHPVGSSHAGGRGQASEGDGTRGGGAAGGRPPSLYCRALCVASELDLSQGNTEDAKAKLEEVLAVDPRSADGLSRLGWLLLGFGIGGSASGSGQGEGRQRGSGREDVEAAKPLLEKAIAEEPGSSCHAFRLARYGKVKLNLCCFLLQYTDGNVLGWVLPSGKQACLLRVLACVHISQGFTGGFLEPCSAA